MIMRGSMTAGNKAEGRKCSREVAESYILHCKKKEKLELPWTFQSSKATQNNTLPPEKNISANLSNNSTMAF